MSIKFNVEVGFISKFLETKDVVAVKNSRVLPSFFTGYNRNAFQFIMDVVQRTGEVPTERVFIRQFPSYTLDRFNDKVGTEENFKFWIDELRNKVKQNALADVVEESAGKLQSLDPLGALALLKQKIAYIESEVEETEDVDITKNTDLRKEAYLKRRETGGMMGLSYGIPFLDVLTKGIKRETLTVILASTGVGKTYMEVLIGAYSMLNSCKVLQFVTEMSTDIMRDRYEALLFAMTYGDFNYNNFKSGALSLEKEKQYFEFLDNDLPHLEPLILITATSPMQVDAEIEKHKPDLVLIDGVYLMEDDERSDSDWLRVAHITRALKRITKRRGTPVIINTQADKNTSKKTGAELGDISFSQSIGMDADDIMTLYRTPLMYADKEMCIKMLKNREGNLGKVTMSWDFTTMNFHEIYNEGGEESFTPEEEEKSAQMEKNLIGVD